MTMIALCADRVLTPGGFQRDHCVVVDHGRIAQVTPRAVLAPTCATTMLDGDLVPGFIDLQVNGGGGVLFNDEPTVEGIAAIGEAHRPSGTTGFLPTLISDDLAVVARAIAAVDAAIVAGVPGVLGIHLEGPFLNPARKGIHDETKFRTIDADAIELLSSLRRGRTLVTLAPERAPPGAIAALVARGVVVAGGHTQATYEEMLVGIAEGLTGFTHLYNAMTSLTGRAPGAVGAALDSASTWCGVIADGHHVHPASLRVALALKGPGRIVLVTDAMPTVGSDRGDFTLGGQRITLRDGRLTSADGTLAGSDLDMMRAVRNAEAMLGIGREVAVRMASGSPAAAIGLSEETGSLEAGLKADLVLLDSRGVVRGTWIGGQSGASV